MLPKHLTPFKGNYDQCMETYDSQIRGDSRSHRELDFYILYFRSNRRSNYITTGIHAFRTFRSLPE